MCHPERSEGSDSWSLADLWVVKRENWLNEDNLVLDETFLTHLITSLEFELVLYATLQRVVLSPLW